MIKIVIFDLDDTLISEKEYVKSGLIVVSKYIEKKYELKNVYEELLELFEEDAKFVYNRFFDRKNISYTDSEIKKMVKIYREHNPVITFYNDVLSTIKYLKECDIRTAVISDGNLNTQKKKASAVKLNDYMDSVLFTDELGKQFWKPNPKSFQILKEKFNVEYNEILYVGDNPKKDFYINKTFPIHTVRIYRKDGIYLNEAYLDEITEEYRINNLNEIASIINELK